MSYFLSQPRIEEPIYLGPSDISLLRARISEAESYLESLENQFKGVCEDKAQISELTRRKDEQLIEIASFRNILSPIRRIPLELLSEIFELSCVPEDGWKSSCDIVLRTFVICRVCIAWRKAAHSTPRLWSKFCHDTRIYRIRDVSGEFEWIREWISRSQSLPLDVYLYVTYGSFSVTKILETVLSTHHRIRLLNLSVCDNYQSYLPFFQSLPQSSFPLLEEISLSCFPLDRQYSPDKIYMLIGAPKLRYADIVADHSFAELLLLPAEQLNSLKIHNPPDYRDLLPRCKGLVHLVINWSQSYARNLRFPTNHFFLLPTLKSLQVSSHVVRGGGAIVLSCLTAPLLEKLTLCQWGGRFCYPFADLSCFQRRSATALSSLTLQNFSAQDDQLFTEELTAALSLLPEIKALHIERFSLNIDPLLQALTYTKDHRDLLPNLTTLTLQPDQFCNDNAIYPKELAAMILSRWWPDMDESVDIDSQLAFDRSGLQRLQKVTLRGYRNAPVEIASVCGLTGLDVEFCNYEGSAYA